MNNLQFLDVNNNFAEWLKDARKEARLTMEKLGDLVGKSKQYISVLERGEPHALTNKPVTPSREVVIALAKALNADENEALKLAGYSSQSDGLIIVGFDDELDPDDVAKIKSYIAFLKSQKK